jgi:hypothetical protein
VIALKIRDAFYKHMDRKINIANLAQKYAVSEQTLQKPLSDFKKSKG